MRKNKTVTKMNGFFYGWWYIGTMPDGFIHAFDSKDEYELEFKLELERLKNRK